MAGTFDTMCNKILSNYITKEDGMLTIAFGWWEKRRLNKVLKAYNFLYPYYPNLAKDDEAGAKRKREVSIMERVAAQQVKKNITSKHVKLAAKAKENVPKGETEVYEVSTKEDNAIKEHKEEVMSIWAVPVAEVETEHTSELTKVAEEKREETEISEWGSASTSSLGVTRIMEVIIKLVFIAMLSLLGAEPINFASKSKQIGTKSAPEDEE